MNTTVTDQGFSPFVILSELYHIDFIDFITDILSRNIMYMQNMCSD